MCVSYRKLKGITKYIELTIPCCDDSITTIGTGSNIIFIISLDTRKGYHQISVRHVNREKLALFVLDNQKFTFLVIPFGPTNTPGFYSSTMKNFKEKWYMIFIETL